MKLPQIIVLLSCLLSMAPAFPAHARSNDVHASQEPITMNLRNVDIRGFITTVSKVTGINFVVDPRVHGNVTVISSTPMDGEAVYQVFLSVLDVNGYTAVPSGDVVKIIPSASARQNSLLHGHGEEIVTQVLKVHNVPVSQIVPMLQPLVPQGGLLAAYPPKNMLIVTDRAENVARIRSLVAQLDQPDTNQIQVVNLHHASATDLAQLLNGLQEPLGNNSTSSLAPHVVADVRTNSLLISADPSDRERLMAIIEKLDVPAPGSGHTRVWYLHYARARDMAKILEKVINSDNSNKSGKVAPESPVSIQSDDTDNVLVVAGPPEKLRDLHEIVRQLDVRPSEVLIDAIIVEVTGNLSKELGAQIAMLPSAGSTQGSAAISNFTNSGTPLTSLAGGAAALGNVGPGLLLGIGRNTAGRVRYALLLHALNSSSATNILSTPSILTLNNTAASIVVGQNVPFVTGSYSSTGTGLNEGSKGGAGTNLVSSPFQTINRHDVGITLKVTPQINFGNTVLLKIDLTVSSLAPSVSGAADLITNKRQIETEVITNNDSIISLGGLIKDSYTDSRQRVPWLSRIPILGHLFRSRSRQRDKENLMIFLHPVIINDQTLANNYTRQKYHQMQKQELYDSIQHGDQGQQNIGHGPTLPLDLRQLAPSPSSKTSHDSSGPATAVSSGTNPVSTQ